ncbi:hypothetical protein M407DRAFT_31137 [Tulasnella calospora MUT 4182]|uniref:Uncharacterized protein n=1 Tax=Tulasnella calospora MUT 4182 TaxID=1051891 RepID=A0A0C3Q644_9AGAM|nr:hypothetical protein M407DRAFT_31137 [Tulasnella calospora MUT 4182]
MIPHSPSTTPHKAQQQIVSEFANFSSTLVERYDTPLGQNGVIRNAASTPKHQRRAFPAHSDRTAPYSPQQPCPVPQSHSHPSTPYPPRTCAIMIFPSTASSSHAVEIVHSPASSTLPREPQQRLITEFASFSRTLKAGYATPLGQNGVLQTVASPLRHEHRAFQAQPDNT